MSVLGNAVKGTLKSKIIDLIRLKGPLKINDYMKLVLTNPSSGFYMNNDVFGVKGHFITSPEISQIFGEVIGAWIIQEWTRFKCPKPLRLVEFGPGRGTLMTDISRTIRKINKSDIGIQVAMIEVSPHLKEVQKKTLIEREPYLQNRVKWFDSVDHLDDNSDGFTAFIAHEFLDAIPIHKFVRDPKSGRFRELLIDYNEHNDLIFSISRQPSLSAKLLIPENFEGDHIEVCPEAALILEKVASHLNKTNKGCMLICDYGFEDNQEQPTDENIVRPNPMKTAQSNRDTFRAFKEHKPWHPLKDPGDADLTADVDFGYLKRHLKNKAVSLGPVDQKTFLMSCGYRSRLEVLLKSATDSERKNLLTGANMVINEMGERYKFLALFPEAMKPSLQKDPPAGFYQGHLS